MNEKIVGPAQDSASEVITHPLNIHAEGDVGLPCFFITERIRITERQAQPAVGAQRSAPLLVVMAQQGIAVCG